MKSNKEMSLNEYAIRIFACILIMVLLALVFLALQLGTIWDSSTNQYIAVDPAIAQSIPSEQLSGIRQEKYLILFDNTDNNSYMIAENASAVIDTMKKSYDKAEGTSFKGSFYDYNAVIVTIRKLDILPYISELSDYVQNGGQLFIAQSVEPDGSYFRMGQLLGIYETGTQRMFHGVHCETDFLFGAQGQTFSFTEDDNFGMVIRLVTDTRVHLRTNDSNPLLWQKDFGTGTIMMFNGTRLVDKRWDGVIASALAYLNRDFIYPVVGSKVIMLSNFPSPALGDSYFIKQVFNTDIDTFIRRVWWKDMSQYASKYNIVYTAFPVLNYRETSEAPFNTISMNKNNFISFSREIIKNGGEIGICSYSQQPHIDKSVSGISGFSQYKDYNEFKTAMSFANDFVVNAMPKYKPRCYFPPANIFSKEGFNAVKALIPSADIVSGMYYNYNNPILYANRFELYEDGVIGLPRISSGFADSDLQKWCVINGANTIGTVVHEFNCATLTLRQDKNWDQLSSLTEELLDFINQAYSSFDPHTASQAAEKVKCYSIIQPYITYEANKINVKCNNFLIGDEFVLRTEKEILRVEGCEVKKISPSAYLVVPNQIEFNLYV